MKNLNTLVFLLGMTGLLTGCGNGLNSVSSGSVASEINDQLACGQARSKIFEAYTKAYQNGARLDAEVFQQDLNLKLNADRLFQKSAPAVKASYQKALNSIHNLLTKKISAMHMENANAGENENDPLLHLARLEMRSHIDPQYESINQELDRNLDQALHAQKEIGTLCATTQTPDNGSSSPTNRSLEASSALYGALFTMATAYQSCEVLSLPPVTASVPSAQGVVKGKMIDSTGYGREYTDVALLSKTHYYHKAAIYGGNCVNQSSKPLVYDYGGVPVVNSSSVDLFTNNGGGGALGIDCSAFVSTAAAVAGNLYSPSTTNKAVYKRFVSRDFINPATSNWTCYKSVTTSASSLQTIQAGDIAAVQGHVVMVDQVGRDPFGLGQISSIAGCDSISYKNFDFTIVQSSPEKGSMGINRYLIKDYLTSGSKMANLFTAYAKAACQTHFDGQGRNPVTTAFGIIRHQQTDACLADRTVLKNESCVQSCAALQTAL